jgi:hypothetical protein
MKIEVGVLQLYADTFHFLKKKNHTSHSRQDATNIFKQKKNDILIGLQNR